MTKKKSNKVNIIISTLLAIVVVFLVSFLVYEIHSFNTEKSGVVESKTMYLQTDRAKYIVSEDDLDKWESLLTASTVTKRYAFVINGELYTVSKQDYDMYMAGDTVGWKGVLLPSKTNPDTTITRKIAK